MKKKQLIVIPAYQPLESLVPLTKEIFEIFENVLVIDDGGQEKYAHIFKQLDEMGAIIVTHAINQGKGRALKSAINYCLLHPEVCQAGIITVDADGQHRPADISKIADKVYKFTNCTEAGYMYRGELLEESYLSYGIYGI